MSNPYLSSYIGGPGPSGVTPGGPRAFPSQPRGIGQVEKSSHTDYALRDAFTSQRGIEKAPPSATGPSVGLPSVPRRIATNSDAPKGAPAPALAPSLAAVPSISTLAPTGPSFVPVNYKGFSNFINTEYARYKLPEFVYNENACNELAQKATVEFLSYQQFVRDFMESSPYRGILVYHGLGSGKTCTSIAAMEAIYSKNQGPVYIMTPATLSANYKDEMGKCGGTIISEIKENSRIVRYINYNGLTKKFIKDQLCSGAINFDGAIVVIDEVHNFVRNIESSDLDDRYAGLAKTNEKLAKAKSDLQTAQDKLNAIQAELKTKLNPVSGRTGRPITISDDQRQHLENIYAPKIKTAVNNVHKLQSRVDNMTLKLKQRREDDPRNVADYTLKKCADGYEAKDAVYLLYRMICNAVGCKIIALSGTPNINYPHEIGSMADLIAGDTRMATATVTGPIDENHVNALKNHREVDFVEVKDSKLHITPVPSRFVKVDNKYMRDDNKTLRERDLNNWFNRVARDTNTSALFSDVKFTSEIRLPDTEKEFTNMFVDTRTNTLKNEDLLKNRLSGLISYYKGDRADLMPEKRENIVPLPMSFHQFKGYLEARMSEIGKNIKEDPTKSSKADTGYFTATRKACNFVFPDGVPQPKVIEEAELESKMNEILAEPETPKNKMVRDAILGYKSAITSAAAKAAKTRMIVINSGDEADDELTSDELAEKIESDVEGIVGEVKEQDVEMGASASGRSVAPALPSKKKILAEIYKYDIMKSFDILKANKDMFFAKGTLSNYSAKFQKIIDTMNETNGPALVYSQFKKLQGLDALALALEAQGYAPFDIVKTRGGKWDLTDATKASAGKKRYMMYTGEETAEKRKVLKDCFNAKWKDIPELKNQLLSLFNNSEPEINNNINGQICKVILITQAGAEGISLENTRQVHIMEPYWNYVRLDQVMGRAIRTCSHKALKKDDRNVDVFSYQMAYPDPASLSPEQITTLQTQYNKVNEKDKGKTIDQIIANIFAEKQKISQLLLNVMKATAVDCELNITENGVACYKYDNDPEQMGNSPWLFRPRIMNPTVPLAGGRRRRTAHSRRHKTRRSIQRCRTRRIIQQRRTRRNRN